MDHCERTWRFPGHLSVRHRKVGGMKRDSKAKTENQTCGFSHLF